MKASRQTRRVEVRFPEQLAEAVEHRADALGVPVSKLVREAVAREVATPIDARSRDVVSAWLNGEEI